jgi:hypothetical protein
VIRIRPGRSWRLNPAYLGELRALTPPRARGFMGQEILDVLGIEVDGVDIAAGVGEAQVLLGVEELAQALLRLGEGEPAAQATIGPGPTELVLEARGADLVLTLVSLAPPARVMAGGLLVDAARMRAAALHAARGLLFDLLAISPVLEDAPLAQRLGEACAQLARRPLRVAPAWPPGDAPALAVGTAQRGPRLVLQLQPEAMARLRSRSLVPSAPLAAHLGRGSLTLARRGAPGLECQGPVFLLLRNLLTDAEALIEAWESGERALTLHFGPHELRCDLATEQVRAPGWRRPADLPPLTLAAQIAEATLAYADLTLRPRRKLPDEYAADLRERAVSLLRHCRDLKSGDLRRAPSAVAAPFAPSGPPPRNAPLAPGRVRRLVYREAWRAQAPGALRVLPLAQGTLLIELPDELEARDAETGERLWSVPAMPGAAVRGTEVFYAEPADALVRLDGTTGEPHWKRRMRGAAHLARLWPFGGGVLRSLPGEGLAFVNDAGALVFRVKLPGGAPTAAAAFDDALLVAAGSGSLLAVDRADGRVLWKRRCRAQAIVRCGGRALVLEEGALVCLDAQGEPAWEQELPAAAATPPIIVEGNALLLAGGAALSFSLADGRPRAPIALPWARHLAACDEDGAVIATGDGGAAARLDSKRWSVPADGPAPALPALVDRGVVLLHRSSTALYDAAEGLPLAHLPSARAATLAADLSCALLHGDGEISMHRLTTHLSVL